MQPALIATLTVSDTRTDADDESGKTLRAGLESAGFRLRTHRIVKDELLEIVGAVRLALHDGASAVILTGGTGIAPRDVTIEAVEPLFDRWLDGFGEAFRRLSWDEIGARAILSRATAGIVGRGIVIALPGSVNAVKLGVEKLILPMLPHALHIVQGAPLEHH